MNSYLMSLSIGGFIALTIPVGYLIAWLIQCIWSFIDETPTSRHNWFVYLVCTLWLCKVVSEDDSAYNFRRRNGKYTDGDYECFISCLIAVLTPIVLWTAFQFYPIALTICTTIGIVFLSRFSRRLCKRLVKHEKNLDAHKEV